VHLTGVGVYLIGVYLKGVYLVGVYLMACTSWGVYLTPVHLIGVYLINVHSTGVHLMIDRCTPHGRVPLSDGVRQPNTSARIPDC
jgi:hypothetical protein